MHYTNNYENARLFTPEQTSLPQQVLYQQPQIPQQTPQQANSIGGFSQPATVGYAQPVIIGGFSQPQQQQQQQPVIIGGFSQPQTRYVQPQQQQQPQAVSIGGFTQPTTQGQIYHSTSAPAVIGGFQQPSTAAPIHSFGGFTTVSSNAGGSLQNYSPYSGTVTGQNIQANSHGTLGPYVQENVTIRGEYQPQTDTASGGRPLSINPSNSNSFPTPAAAYVPQTAPIVQPIAQVTSYPQPVAQPITQPITQPIYGQQVYQQPPPPVQSQKVAAPILPPGW
eukprot:CAMPEP_0174820602 /NCGR_PEP_ID=MMETSP1107-20130205/4530_1 /TAXON_ID=36770 /ORGANISM="Paraphysomonas vestita, Strain GFlagA" /LENGTH=278 /DNA_ID=CAMNT_0016036249 /DNA_START=423 /DNA_END=1256 /DNA_ORIENTATION=+